MSTFLSRSPIFIRSVAVAAALGWVFGLATSASADIFRVGFPGALDCDAFTVQEAVDLAVATPGEHEIRLSGSNMAGFGEEVIIDNFLSNDKLTN